LIWWSPYRSPYGPHMEAIVPIPWAHVIFGQKAMLRAAAMVYDSDAFVPTLWNLDEHGRKKPNEWRSWTSFPEQGHLNEMTESQFFEVSKRAGFEVSRFEPKTFSGTPVRRLIGGALLKMPVVGEYMVSYYIAELTRR